VVVIIIIIIIVFLGQPGGYEIVNMFADSFFLFFLFSFSMILFLCLFQGSELGRTNLLPIPIELRRTTTTDMQTTLKTTSSTPPSPTPFRPLLKAEKISQKQIEHTSIINTFLLLIIWGWKVFNTSTRRRVPPSWGLSVRDGKK
jgi:hypothetical protein